MDMLTAHHAVGVFVDRSVIEAALHQLKQADFPMKKVSVVAKQRDLQETQVQSEDQFKRHETIQELERGAVGAGVLGGIAGMLLGLTTLLIPGLETVTFLGVKAAIVGSLVGAFYGSVGGMILGGAFGQGISREQVQFYDEQVAQGHYVLVIEGSASDLKRAKLILKDSGIQNWIEHRAL
jgi:hypothetical protein